VLFILLCSLKYKKIIVNIKLNDTIKKNAIPIAFSINDTYVYPLIVLLTSILYNSSKKTFYIFYLLLSPDLQNLNIKKILNLRKKYQNCFINLIYMEEKFSKYHLKHDSVAVYYRLELSNIILDFDKIIYLDVDTIVHKDLTEFYNLDMKNYYYMGFPDHDIINYEFNGKRNFINSGVMLINLKKLREVNAPKLLKDYYKTYGSLKEDEYLINAVFHDQISFLPLIYGIPDFGAGNKYTVSSFHFWNWLKNFTNFTFFDLENSSKNRVITHGCYESKKWWKRKYNNLTKIGKKWLFYASKSNIFDDICRKYYQFRHYCDKIKKGTKKFINF
jgi:lipopolysaccharide biosynthesis glycosyltransferase